MGVEKAWMILGVLGRDIRRREGGMETRDGEVWV
jgi:hypothetical protein